MPDFSQAFDDLADPDTAMMVAGGLGGFMIPTVAENLSPVNLPSEVYGLATYTAYRAMPETVPAGQAVGVGALTHTGVQAAERFQVRSTIENIGQGGE